MLRASGDAPRLSGRTIAVAGATGGVGEGLSRTLLMHGATVVALGRSRVRLDGLARRMDGAGPGQLVLRVLDVGAPDSASVTRALAEFGPLDGAVISIGDPGRPAGGTVLDIGDSEWDRMVAANQTAGMRALRALTPAVARDGVLVNLLGYSSEIPFPHHPVMAATNAALRSLVRTLSVQLRPTGPGLYGLVLGVVRTRARQAAGVDDPEWLTGELVGEHVIALLERRVTDPEATLHYLLDPRAGMSPAPPDPGAR